MKYLLIPMVLFFISCKEKDNWGKYVVNDHIPLDSFWMKVTGYDSLQIIGGYKGEYLKYNFCYPNKWQFKKFKKDTVFIHDTVIVVDIASYKSKKKQ